MQNCKATISYLDIYCAPLARDPFTNKQILNEENESNFQKRERQADSVGRFFCFNCFIAHPGRPSYHSAFTYGSISYVCKLANVRYFINSFFVKTDDSGHRKTFLYFSASHICILHFYYSRTRSIPCMSVSSGYPSSWAELLSQAPEPSS